MTRLIVTITGETFEAAQAQVAAAWAGGADGVELRLDCMPDLSDADVAALCADRPADAIVLLTIRGRDEGGYFDGDDADRVSRLIALGPLADWIDVEHALWTRSANLRQKVMLAVRRARRVEHDHGREAVDHAGRRMLVLSRHGLQGRPPRLHGDLLAMLDERACDIVKIAWDARTVRENFEAFDLLRSVPKPTIAVCLGPVGLASRVLARKFGAAAMFAAADGGRPAAAGQLALSVMKSLYCWDRIGPHTAVYGLVGDPVGHSAGPAVHNAAFSAAGVDAVYLPLPVQAGYEPFKAFMVEALARPWLDLRGLSVTAPHKQNAWRFITEQGGTVETSADSARAANTLLIDPAGTLTALNTDLDAVRDSLAAAVGGTENLRGLDAAVLGAGGVARTCVAALCAAGASVTVYSRNAARAALLAAESGCAWREWAAREEIRRGLLVNATPVGQWPAVDDSPMAGCPLARELVVFDTVYRPARTRLLREAESAGCEVVGGLEMFLRQAAEQWRRWIGREPPRDVMRRAAADALRDESAA